MALLTSKTPITRTRRGAAVAPGRAAFLVPVIGSAVVLLAPIVLWAAFGDGDVMRTLEIALAAALLSWAVARRAEDRDAAGAPAIGRPRPRHGSKTTACKLERRRTEPPKRLQRDVRCAKAQRPLERRPVRRRSRP